MAVSMTAKSLEAGHQPSHDRTLARHTSSLPNFLYFLSFAPPLPSIWRQPRAFFAHPWVLYALALPGAIISGVALPAFDIVLGYWSQVIQSPDSEPDAIIARGNQAGWIMAIIAAAFIAGYAAMFVCFSMAGAKLGDLLREQYLAAILVQDQAFFDRIGPGEIVTRAGKDINLIRTGLGEKLGYLTWSLAIILACFVSAFVHAPKLAGVLFAIIPFTFIIFTVLGIWSDAASQAADKLDGKASSLIEQILSSVRIVQAFNINDKLLLKLENEMLRPLRVLSRRKSFVKSVELAAAFGAGFLVYAVSFWYGGITISEGTEVGDVLTAFYNYVNLFFTFAGVVPHFLAASQAIHAIGNLRLHIEREPPIDVRDPSGLILSTNEKGKKWESSFDLQNVTFAYPARPTHKALDDLNLHIQPGKFTALVGPSGSGKSTLASLLLRLYDPSSATVLTDLDRRVIENFKEGEKKKAKGKGENENEEEDARAKQAKAMQDEILASDEKRVQGAGVIRYAGTDIREYNLRWLRRQVAVVLQNPQLVSGSVYDNVVVGLTGTDLEYRPSSLGSTTEEGRKLKAIIDERVEDALRKAQAWDFVSSLPEGWDTKVSGGRTGVLSGGQVQRVALARALVSRPTVLLLDEATSAVSADTEADIQAALLEEQKATGMTLIVIAHRLSTIVAADRIYVMVAGQARASGTYDELMRPDAPDQTFRSMALVKQEVYTGKGSDGGDDKKDSAGNNETSRGSSSQTIAPTRSRLSAMSRLSAISKRRQPLSQLESPSRPLPSRMRKVGEAFRNTRMLFLAGCVLYVVGAASFIISAWLHGRGVASFGITPFSAMRAAANRWALYFFILTLGTFAIMIFASYGLEYSGERIVSDYRRESVRALLKQEVAYFEDTTHTAGESKGSGGSEEDKDKGGGGGAGGLTAAVAYHPSNVGNVIGLILGQVIVSAAAFVGTIILAFTLTWRLAVMVLPALALNTGAGYINFLFQDRFDKQLNDDTEAQSSFVAESANSIQMLAALTREAETVRQFKAKFTDRDIKVGWLVTSGVALGVSQGVLELFGGLIFYWGAQQLARRLVSVADLFTIIEAVIVAVYICARIWTYTGDFARMGNSLRTIQKWLKRESRLKRISATSSSVSIVNESSVAEDGKASGAGISFNNVTLRYPSRPTAKALDGVSLHMEPGKAYAFCGTSGAGKSSVMAVLERYYEIAEGSVTVDGRDIRAMDVDELRGMMGYVSQEAVLFEDTVRWNLLAGALEPEKVTQADLEWACEQACILEFIQTLPEGFDTDLGLKGGQLSGGQRQRLCIARALLRRPRILLLDEATSALDGNSEAHVQQALDNASKGRLTITVAHRLSTIRKADVIFVMEQGRVVEQGSHDQLVEFGGRYFELVQAQL